EWGGRGVKEKNTVVATRDVVSPSVIDEPVVEEKQSLLVDTSIPNVEKTSLSSYPPLPMQGSTLAGNTPGMSSYYGLERIKKRQSEQNQSKPTRNGKDKAMSEDLKPKIKAGSV
ncbi:hypothetical protein Tco_1537293, partial [Tanacetum coccineum]